MKNDNLRMDEAKKVTIVGFILNGILSIFKLIAGIIGKSSAMIADAVHSISDFFTDIVVLVGFKLTSKPEDECHNYGHGKYEALATITIVLLLAIVAFQILRSGIINIFVVINGGTLEKPKVIALVAAVISIFLKEILFQYTIKVGKKINSSAIKANAWHHRSDALSSIGSMIGIGLAIILGSKWVIFDPIASIIVSLMIFKVAYDILIPSLRELTDGSLNIELRNKIIEVLDNEEEVLDYHKLRMRMVGIRAVIECHIEVDPKLNIKHAHDIATAVEVKLKEFLGKDSIITIHIEPYIKN